MININNILQEMTMQDLKNKVFRLDLPQHDDIAVFNKYIKAIYSIKSKMYTPQYNAVLKYAEQLPNLMKLMRKELRKSYGNKSTITLYRGLSFNKANGKEISKLKDARPGDEIKLVSFKRRSVSEWTTHKNVAYHFAKPLGGPVSTHYTFGVVLEAQVPLDDIIYSVDIIGSRDIVRNSAFYFDGFEHEHGVLVVHKTPISATVLTKTTRGY